MYIAFIMQILIRDGIGIWSFQESWVALFRKEGWVLFVSKLLESCLNYFNRNENVVRLLRGLRQAYG